MTSADHEYQAQQFVAWHEKRGGSWEDNFGAWAATKDFMPRDQLAIRRAVHELITSDNVSVDVFDFLRIGQGA
jgi:hypothetical protein